MRGRVSAVAVAAYAVDSAGLVPMLGDVIREAIVADEARPPADNNFANIASSSDHSFQRTGRDAWPTYVGMPASPSF